MERILMYTEKFPAWVDSRCEKIASFTQPFMSSKVGRIFQLIVLLGPFTFIPTIYGAWFDTNIDALRTLTWPFMTAVNTSAFLIIAHTGNWKMRVASFLWVPPMALIWLATIFR